MRLCAAIAVFKLTAPAAPAGCVVLPFNVGARPVRSQGLLE